MPSIWIMTAKLNRYADPEIMGVWVDNGNQSGANAAQDAFETVVPVIHENPRYTVRGDDGTGVVKYGDHWIKLDVFGPGLTPDAFDPDTVAKIKEQEGFTERWISTPK